MAPINARSVPGGGASHIREGKAPWCVARALSWEVPLPPPGPQEGGMTPRGISRTRSLLFDERAERLLVGMGELGHAVAAHVGDDDLAHLGVDGGEEPAGL